MLRYEIDVHHRGSQIRRYGPHVADATIKIISGRDGFSVVPHDDWFKKVFKGILVDFYERGEEPHWYVYTLKEFKRIDDQTAYLKAERPYDD